MNNALPSCFCTSVTYKMCGFLLRPNAERVVAENISAFPLDIVSSFCEQLSHVARFAGCASDDQNIFLFFFSRFLETGRRSDFNKIRMKLSEMGSIQLQNLRCKSRQLRDAIQQEVMKEDCVFVNDYEGRNLMNFFVSDRFPDYGRRIEVVTLD